MVDLAKNVPCMFLSEMASSYMFQKMREGVPQEVG